MRWDDDDNPVFFLLLHHVYSLYVQGSNDAEYFGWDIKSFPFSPLAQKVRQGEWKSWSILVLYRARKNKRFFVVLMVPSAKYSFFGPSMYRLVTGKRRKYDNCWTANDVHFDMKYEYKNLFFYVSLTPLSVIING